VLPSSALGGGGIVPPPPIAVALLAHLAYTALAQACVVATRASQREDVSMTMPTPHIPDRSADEAALLLLEEADRTAHFAADAAALLAHDTDPVLFVRDGKVLPWGRAELTALFAEDMRGATYHEWDYVEPPIVRVSRDASLAWVIARRRVCRTKRRDDGSTVQQQFMYSGLNAYEKRDGAWVRVANVPTFGPVDEGAADESAGE
jgi:hypothetical protein